MMKHTCCLQHETCLLWPLHFNKEDIIQNRRLTQKIHIPLFVCVDNQFCEWYKLRFDRDIPKNDVLSVQKALQGHPESSRLWALYMDKILKSKFNLKPTTHEGCLYQGHYKNEEVLFLRQVDNFEVAAEHESTATLLINEIDSHMTIQIKNLGLLSGYNGVNITQSKYYVK